MQTAWYMGHRIRKAFEDDTDPYWIRFFGTVEVDEAYFGGKRKNMPKKKRALITGRDSVGKIIIIAIKERNTNKVKTKVIKETTKDVFHEFIDDTVYPSSFVYTDDHSSYKDLDSGKFHHDSVRHRTGELVKYNDLKYATHTNEIESFWAMLKQEYKGTYHLFSEKHMDRYANEFAGRYNVREEDRMDQMESLVRDMNSKRLRYEDLIAA